MELRGFSRHLPVAIASALVVLLTVLAVLQYRWIGQVSALERQRMQASLLDAGSRFTQDFDREVTRAFMFFHPADPVDAAGMRQRVVRQHERWMSEAPYPQLVGGLYLARRTPAGDLDLEVLKPEAGRFEPVPWPAGLNPLRRRLAAGYSRHGAPHGSTLPVAADIPALVIPPMWQLRFEHHGHSPGRVEEPAGTEYLIVQLDADAIRKEILPDLTRRHFGTAQGRDYALAVVPADNPDQIFFQSDPSLPPTAFRSGDIRLDLFGLRPFDELRSLWRGRGRGLFVRRSARWPEIPGMSQPAGGERGGAWQLVVKHRNGSLEEAVAGIRRRNLAVGAGILALLAAASGLMVVTTQRAQALVRQQIELVAGVSHELRTPLTAIRSAGQNLAAGVVADPPQVKRYGQLIESEGRRLSHLVGQVLEFSSLAAERKTYTLRPAGVEEIVEGALEDCRWLLQERQANVETEVAPGLPAVLGDAGALRRALRNLIENAAKYGGRPPRIEVRARAVGKEVEVTVEDRGPGIRREDLPRLFDPFYRGREGTGGNPGSGLGLSIVRRIAEAHRGRVTVAANPGQGSAFTLHLPAASGEVA